MEVHYSNLYAACPDWRAEKLVLEHIERGENKIWTSSSVVVDAARCLRKEGKLDELTFFFHYDMNDVNKIMQMESDKDGRLAHWPAGFCDVTENFHCRILGWGKPTGGQDGLQTETV